MRNTKQAANAKVHDQPKSLPSVRRAEYSNFAVMVHSQRVPLPSVMADSAMWGTIGTADQSATNMLHSQ